MGKASRNMVKEQATAAAEKLDKAKKKQPDQVMEYGIKRSATKPGKQKSKYFIKKEQQSLRKCVIKRDTMKTFAVLRVFFTIYGKVINKFFLEIFDLMYSLLYVNKHKAPLTVFDIDMKRHICKR